MDRGAWKRESRAIFASDGRLMARRVRQVVVAVSDDAVNSLLYGAAPGGGLLDG